MLEFYLLCSSIPLNKETLQDKNTCTCTSYDVGNRKDGNMKLTQTGRKQVSYKLLDISTYGPRPYSPRLLVTLKNLI